MKNADIPIEGIETSGEGRGEFSQIWRASANIKNSVEGQLKKTYKTQDLRRKSFEEQDKILQSLGFQSNLQAEDYNLRVYTSGDKNILLHEGFGIIYLDGNFEFQAIRFLLGEKKEVLGFTVMLGQRYYFHKAEFDKNTLQEANFIKNGRSQDGGFDSMEDVLSSMKLLFEKSVTVQKN